jgi:hypothetical protein
MQTSSKRSVLGMNWRGVSLLSFYAVTNICTVLGEVSIEIPVRIPPMARMFLSQSPFYQRHNVEHGVPPGTDLRDCTPNNLRHLG